MSFGMEIFSSGGVLQANAELFGYFCRKSSTVTSQADPGYGLTIPSIFIVPKSTYTYPIIAFSTNGYSIARVSTTTGGDYVFASNAPIGQVVNYFIYDYAPTLPAMSSPYGLEIFNASGLKTYSSDQFPMRIRGLITTGSQTETGRTIAVAFPRAGAYRTAGNIRYIKGFVEVIPPDGAPWSYPEDYDKTFYDQESRLYGGSITNSGQTINFTTVNFSSIRLGPETGDIFVLPDYDVPIPIIAVDVTGIPLNTTFF